MNNPDLYIKANEIQRHDAQEIIKAYSQKLQWRLDGCDALLDVGTGSGDVLMDFIYAIMPTKFERILGTDISPKMIEYAKNLYASYEKCDFEILDIGSEKDLPTDIKEKFDHVTSFYCLHWVVNKRQAFRNIFDLLRAEGGDCLLVFLSSSPVYDVYKSLSKSNKWCSYMKDVDRFINPLHYVEHPDLEIFNMLDEAGFSDIEVEVKQKVYGYEGVENFKANMKPINPFLDRMPPALHESYFDDLIDLVTSLNFKQKHPTKELDYVFNFPYNLIIIQAKKLPKN